MFNWLTSIFYTSYPSSTERTLSKWCFRSNPICFGKGVPNTTSFIYAWTTKTLTPLTCTRNWIPGLIVVTNSSTKPPYSNFSPGVFTERSNSIVFLIFRSESPVPDLCFSYAVLQIYRLCRNHSLPKQRLQYRRWIPHDTVLPHHPAPLFSQPSEILMISSIIPSLRRIHPGAFSFFCFGV